MSFIPNVTKDNGNDIKINWINARTEIVELLTIIPDIKIKGPTIHNTGLLTLKSNNRYFILLFIINR